MGQKRLRIWRFPTGSEGAETPLTAPTRLPIMPYSVTRSADGNTVVVGRYTPNAMTLPVADSEGCGLDCHGCSLYVTRHALQSMSSHQGGMMIGSWRLYGEEPVGKC